MGRKETEELLDLWALLDLKGSLEYLVSLGPRDRCIEWEHIQYSSSNLSFYFIFFSSPSCFFDMTNNSASSFCSLICCFFKLLFLNNLYFTI